MRLCCVSLLVSVVGATAGDLGRAVVETAMGERIEGVVSVDKTGLRVTDSAGAVREIAPADLRVARLVKGEAAATTVTAPTPLVTPGGLRGSYFNGKELGGNPQTRIDGRIDFAWGQGVPMGGIEAEGFSVRWEGFVEAAGTGDHVFHLLSNDGARLWIDGRSVVDAWRDQADTESAGTIALEAGKRYPLRLEMYEQGGTATARLFWTPPGGPREIVPDARFFQPDPNAPVTAGSAGGSGLRGTYFASRNLDGFSVERLDPEVNFNWDMGDPGVGPGVGNENFSVRWEGWLEGPVTGTVNFIVRADDGVRLWVDERQIIDQWHDGSAAEYPGQIDLEKGKKYPLKLEYYENAAQATVSLSWQAEGIGKQIIPSRFLNPGRAGSGSAAFSVRVHLRGGSLLVGNLHAMDQRNLVIETGTGEIAIPLRGIALLQFGDLPGDRVEELFARKPGCLQRNGEYFEGDLLGYEDGRLRLSSILFGIKTVDIGNVSVVISGTRKVRDAKFTVSASGEARILANELTVEGGELKLLDNSFSRIVLPLASVEEIRGGAYGK